MTRLVSGWSAAHSRAYFLACQTTLWRFFLRFSLLPPVFTHFSSSTA